MAQVKGKIKLIKHNTGWSFILIDPENLKQQAVEKFVRGSEAIQSIVLDMTIKAGHVEKSLSQLGYLHAACFPVYYQHYIDQGIQVVTQEQKEAVRDAIKYAISFVVEVPDFKGGVHYKPKSLAGASKEEVSEFIEALIRLAAEYSMIVPEPAEYLEQHGAKDFE